jgi:elongation factor Ts
VLVEVDCETDFVARTEQFRGFVKNVALHIASMNPLCVAPEDIPEDQLAEERSAVEKQAAEMGKPENVTQKIVDGRMDKWIAERALLTQPYVKDEDNTVGELLQETIAAVGENVVIRRFVRYEL